MISTIDYQSFLYHLMETYVLSSSHLVLYSAARPPETHEVTNLCGVHSAASGNVRPPFTGFASVDEGG